MWCCKRSFSSLSALRQHFVEQGSFLDTRLATMDMLKAAVSGDPGARQAIFEEPLRSQLSTMLEENSVWQMAMFDKLKRHNDFNENNHMKRSRRER
jgi:hypothetical protein